MSWLFYAFLCAFSEALKDISSKRGLRDLDPLVVTWVFFLIPTLLCWPLLLFEPLPALGPGYWWCLLAHGTFYGISVYLYMRAIALAELSLTVPLIMLTPVFMLVTSPIVLDEWPTAMGLVGVLLIVLGSYLLNINARSNGFLGPFRALLAEPGARLMLLVALIWSVTSVIDKLGIQNSAPVFWGLSVFAFVSVFMSLALLLRSGSRVFRPILSHWRLVLPVGLFNSVQMLAYVLAMHSGLAVYVLAIKRTSVLMVMVLGAVFFGEQKLKQRAFAAVIMLLGVFCISFW